VLLVDADTDGPVEEITEKGIRAGGKEYEFDIIVFATGFDAFTGSLKALNIKGRGGRALNDAWADGPRTYLGLAVAGFPNLFTITGPQSPSVLANMPVAIEQHVEWIADCIAYMREHGLTTVEAVPTAQDNWVAHVNEVVNGTLLPLGNSWWMSANIPGKPRGEHRRSAMPAGSLGCWKARSLYHSRADSPLEGTGFEPLVPPALFTFACASSGPGRIPARWQGCAEV
jgi:hypothetical protein